MYDTKLYVPMSCIAQGTFSQNKTLYSATKAETEF